MSLSIKGLGLALGTSWAIGMFVLAFMAMYGWGNSAVEAISAIYIGYEASFLGAVIGAFWGFLDGFVGGLVIAWLYNKFA